MNISVKINELTKKFGDFTAVNKISAAVGKGEIFGFLGANGAGKTTTIRMLCGLLQPTSGEGFVAGHDIFTESEKIKQNVGYMSQKFSLYNDLKVRENVEFFGGIYGLSNKVIKERRKELFDLTGLTGKEKYITKSLPLGFKQRLALVCATLHDPDLVFLDEPTSGIDPQARRNFWELIYEMGESGKTIFVTTHYMDEAEYCHRVSIMRKGKIIALDSPANLRAEYGKTMQDVFIKLVKDKKLRSPNET